MDEKEETTNPHGAGRPKSLPKEFLRMDWEAKPGQPNITKIKKIMISTDKKQEKELKDVSPIPDSTSNMSKVLVWNEKRWTVAGQRCLDCGKVMSKQTIIDKHASICNKALLINKQEEQELLELVRKNDAST